MNFGFLVAFFWVGVFIVGGCIGSSSWAFGELYNSLFKSGNYWFVKAYFLLYLLSPILNAYAEKATMSTFRSTLIAFFLFQTIMSWATKSMPDFCNGYSTLSFIGLYLLARYVRIYGGKIFTYGKRVDIGVILVMILIQMGIIALFRYKEVKVETYYDFYGYHNPFVIVTSLYMLLLFSKLHFQSVWVNKIAVSAFAVYLLHNHPLVINYYLDTVRYLYREYSDVYYVLYLSAFLIAVFILSIIVDQVRIFLWNKLSPLIIKLEEKYS